MDILKPIEKCNILNYYLKYQNYLLDFESFLNYYGGEKNIYEKK